MEDQVAKYKSELISPQNLAKELPENVYFFIDYEGALVPEKNQPTFAKPSKKLVSTLDAIIEHPNCRLALLSNHPMSEITKCFPYAAYDLVGVSGCQIKPIMEPSFHSINIRQYRPLIGEMLNDVRDNFPASEGYSIKDKETAIGIYYTKASKTAASNKISALKKRWKGRMEAVSLGMAATDSAIEIRPQFVTKATGIRYLMNRFLNKMSAVYIAADSTDDSVLALVDQTGITVKVGKPPKKKTSSPAKFYIESPDGVIKFLNAFSAKASKR